MNHLKKNLVFVFIVTIFLSSFLSSGCAHKPDINASEVSSPAANPQPEPQAASDDSKTTARKDALTHEPEDELDLWDKENTPKSSEKPAAASPESGEKPEAETFDEGLNDDLDIWDAQVEEESAHVPDPLAPWNRIMFQFNDKLYFRVLKPVAKGYRAVTPELFRIGVKNFFQNLATPIRLVNCILQGKISAAEIELARFIVNSTAGIVGFGDVADKDPQLKKPSEEDLGQTLAVYGVGNGFYIVWPIMGPSTLRDSAGMIGDLFLNPLSHPDMPAEASAGITAFEVINETSFRLGDYETFKEAAIEPYESLRDAYIQYRKKKVKDTEKGKGEKRYDILIKDMIHKWIN
ncbi:MAG: hypothetical protein BWK80_62805 [Desulfobacteraceae bacterium IS3]|nr:MAG: hypothetical protein BWK80_62805 [Desulfobacteraceae bacterium IS3]